MTNQNTITLHKISTLALCFGILITAALLLCAPACAASSNSESTVSSDLVYGAGVILSNPEFFPGTLMPGEEGTVRITMKNTGIYPVFTDEIYVYSGNGIKLTLSEQSVGSLNPGDSLTIPFLIRAGNTCGTFYPYITVNYYYNNIDENVHGFAKLPLAVTVDDKSLSMSVITRPDSFQPNSSQTLVLTLGNLRRNTIEGIELTAAGKGVTSREGSTYVGSLAANASKNAAITVVTSENTDKVDIIATYRNGANWHTQTLTLPLTSGTTKTTADLVINNIAVKEEKEYTSVTGDVNNAGLTQAKAIVVTTKDTIEAGPYPEYVVGGLDTDGISDFTVTFKTDKPKVSLFISYKDILGNEYYETKEVTIRKNETKLGSSFNMNTGAVLPTVLIIIVAVVALIIGIVAWRKGLFRSRKNQ